ncbi:hypothetical protein ACN38_g11638, partial [Penicillium nordicum]
MLYIFRGIDVLTPPQPPPP